MTNPPIRTIDKEAIAGILKTGRPAGLWIAEHSGRVRFWTGADSRNGKTAAKYGTFGEVLTWLTVRAGIAKRRTQVRERIVDPDDAYSGIVATRAGITRIPKDELRRAKKYTGFSVYIKNKQ